MEKSTYRHGHHSACGNYATPSFRGVAIAMWDEAVRLKDTHMPTPQTHADQTAPPSPSNFDMPNLVVADPALSKSEKSAVLDEMEQDALQMATAANEGMAGGEPTALAEVLQAKEALELPPTDFAYGLVLKDLEAKRRAGVGDVALLAQTIVALEILRKSAG
jgi:hypothetical protein